MKSYKYLIIGLIILICIALGIILLNSNDKAVLNLNGDEIITINQGDINNQDKVNEIKIGDIVHSDGHVGIVEGVSNTELKVLNEREGIRVSFISKTNGKSRNGDKNFDNFVLFDDFFKMYGNS